MKDLLEDMPLSATENGEASPAKKDKSLSPTKKKRGKFSLNKQKSATLMDKFYIKVDTIKSDIEQLSAATAKVDEQREKALVASSTQEENAVTQKVKGIVSKANKLAKKTKDKLCQLEEDNKTLVQKGKIKYSDQRIRDNLCTTLNRKFCDEIRLYQEAQQAYKTETLGKIKRQVQIVKPHISDEELSTVMNNKGGREALYKEMVLAGGVASEVKATYDNVTAKYQHIQTLQASVAELHQIFLDVALLTEQQGEMLDQIEFQVEKSNADIEEGNGDLKESINCLEKRKKRCCIIRTIVVAGVLILVLVLIL